MEKRGKIAWLLVSIVMELVYCKIACMFTWDSFKKCRVKFQVGTPACKFMFFINPFVPNAPFLYSLKKVLWKLPQGKFPPGKLPPIKLPAGKFPPGKFPSRKFPTGISPPISLIVFLHSFFTQYFFHKWERGLGRVHPPILLRSKILICLERLNVPTWEKITTISDV